MNDYERIKKAIQYIEANSVQQPCLEQIAEELGLSVTHFHRLFRRWAGTTPKSFLQHLTVIEAKNLLIGGESVLDAALEVGLSGPSRLHDLCVNFEAASPGEIARRGEGWEIRLGFCETPFGEALIAESPRGICHLSFLDSAESQEEELQEVQSLWSRATFKRDDDHVTQIAKQVFSPLADVEREPIHVLVKGTKFQLKVWRALLALRSGELSTYGQIAQGIQSPRAHRAVGSAIGKNSLAFLIPCHRVIQSTGGMGGYRWGETRKKAMIAFEQISK